MLLQFLSLLFLQGCTSYPAIASQFVSAPNAPNTSYFFGNISFFSNSTLSTGCYVQIDISQYPSTPTANVSIAIHSGVSYGPALGGHLWAPYTKSATDPWTQVFPLDSYGRLLTEYVLDFGYTPDLAAGHVLVIRNSSTGAHLAYSPVGVNNQFPTHETANIVRSPLYGGSLNVSGQVEVWDMDYANASFLDEAVNFRLSGFPINTTGTVRIHAGLSCDNASSPFWNATATSNPWGLSTSYQSNDFGVAEGVFRVNNGYKLSENKYHAVVVTSANLTTLACGILGGSLPTSAPTPVANTSAPTPYSNGTNTSAPTPYSNATNTSAPTPYSNGTNTSAPTPYSNGTNTSAPTPYSNGTNTSAPTPYSNGTNTSAPTPYSNGTNTSAPTPYSNGTNTSAPTPYSNGTNTSAPTPYSNGTNTSAPTPYSNGTNTSAPTPYSNGTNTSAPTPYSNITNVSQSCPIAEIQGLFGACTMQDFRGYCSPQCAANVGYVVQACQAGNFNVTGCGNCLILAAVANYWAGNATELNLLWSYDPARPVCNFSRAPTPVAGTVNQASSLSSSLALIGAMLIGGLVAV